MAKYRIEFAVLVRDALLELIRIDPTASELLLAFEKDLSASPKTAGQAKVGGHYVGRRGHLELTCFIDDGDLIVRVARYRRVSHPYDVTLSADVARWFWSNSQSIEGELALSVLNHLLGKLSSDPRLLGTRLNGEKHRYSVTEGRVVLEWLVSEDDRRVSITSFWINE